MRVLFYLIYGNSTPVFEAELELVYKHLQAGDELLFLKCGETMKACMFNPTHDLASCALCQGRIWKGLEETGVKNPIVYDLLPLHQPGSVPVPEFKSVVELKAWEFEGVDIGMSVASSVISQTRDHRFDTVQYRDRVLKTVDVAINALYNARYYYEKLKPDRVYVFNGRFADQRPFLRVGQQMGIEIALHERGCTYKYHNVTYNTLPHDGDYVQAKMREMWANAPANRNELGAKWFEDRASGVMQSTISFVSGQDKNQLPDGFDPKKMNIGIFNSSQDEYEAIFATYNLKLFADQNDAIRSVAKHFIDNPNIHFYLRVHPNLKNLDCTQTREIKALNSPNLTVIPAESPVGSYKLLQACDKAMVMGSAMGPEATYWGKPSILIGSSAYNTLDCTYNPETLEELYQLLAQNNLEPKPKENALIYGYYNGNFGYPYTLFQADGLWEGTFKGKKLWVDHYFFANVYSGLRKRLNEGILGKLKVLPILDALGFKAVNNFLLRRQIAGLKGNRKI